MKGTKAQGRLLATKGDGLALILFCAIGNTRE